MELEQNVLEEMHSQLAPDLENSEDSTSDEEGDTFSFEWETVNI